MEDNVLALLALCGLFSHAVSLSIRNPYVLPRNHQSLLNYKRTNWQNSEIYDAPSLARQQSLHSDGPTDTSVFLPESLEELRQWWSSVVSRQKGLLPDSLGPDLGGPSSNFEEDFSDTPQDYSYFYGLDPFSETLSSDEAFRQALKAYILPGNPFLRIENDEGEDDRTMTGSRGLSSIQSISPNDDREQLPDFFFRSYPQKTAEVIKSNESKKQIFIMDLPLQTRTDSTSMPLPATEATSQTPVSAAPSVFPKSTPLTKAKGQKEFAMLRPPSDNVRKFDQWAKSAQDYMKSVASAAVRETREARPAPLSKTEDTLSQQLSSLKRRSKRHTSKRFRDGIAWYY